MPDFRFTEDAFSEYLYWQSEDRRTLKRINLLLKAIQREPFSGEGKPEPLKGNYTGIWSRRINEKDRLLYSVDGDAIIIYACRSHYGEK